MNFTREPIIETIISPKDGYKLCVRNSRGSSVEEYFVDAIEVVSFGRAFFFRSLERPKSFLVPVTDYEVIEVKETRVALKNASHERSIKIGGGREAPLKHAKEQLNEEPSEANEDGEEAGIDLSQDVSVEVSSESRGDKKRDRRRHRRRRLAEERREWLEKEKQEQTDPSIQQDNQSSQDQVSESEEPAKVSSAMFSSLIPPPSTLISDTIARYKEKEGLEGAFFTRPQKEHREDISHSQEEVGQDQQSSTANQEDDGSSSVATPNETTSEDI